jgi:hypothetical protein
MLREVFGNEFSPFVGGKQFDFELRPVAFLDFIQRPAWQRGDDEPHILRQDGWQPHEVGRALAVFQLVQGVEHDDDF